MGSVAHISAGCWVGGQHTPLGGVVWHQHVNAQGSRWVQTLHDGAGGDIKTQRCHPTQGLVRWRRSGFNGRA